MSDDNRKYELLKNLEDQVDNDAKEVTIKIDAVDIYKVNWCRGI